MKSSILSAFIGSAILVCVPFSSANAVQDGWFIGGSIGSAQVEANVNPGDLPEAPPSFDESDFGWKLFGGRNWVLARTFGLGFEAGYVDLGNPSGNVSALPVQLDPTLFDVFGVVGFDLGPVGIFGKVGYAWWDVDIDVEGTSASDSGNDVAYGIGARFNLFSLEIRGEYELFDISDVDDASLWSVGVVWRF